MANVFSGEDGGCEPPLSAALGLHGLGRGLFATCSHHRLPNAEFSEEPAARQAWPLPQAVIITKCPTDVGEDFSASLLPSLSVTDPWSLSPLGRSSAGTALQEIFALLWDQRSPLQGTRAGLLNSQVCLRCNSSGRAVCLWPFKRVNRACPLKPVFAFTQVQTPAPWADAQGCCRPSRLSPAGL